MQMYKNKFNHLLRFNANIKKAVLLATLILVTVSVPAQVHENPSVQITRNMPTIVEIFKSISQQTNLTFTYDQYFDLKRKVDLPKTKVPVSEIISIVLKGTGRSFVIANNNVLIRLPKAEETQATQIPAQPQVERNSIVTQRVEGKVNSEGTPVYGSVVSLITDGHEPFITTTNIDGEFRFDNVPAGEYKLNASHLDYGSASSMAAIKQGAESGFEITLPSRTVQESEQSINANLRMVSVQTKELVQGIRESKQQALPKFVLKTNIIYDALTNINFGFEVRLSSRLTLDVPVNYNPWVFANNKRLNNILVQPELRWWISEPFNGHFLGIHGHFAHFNTAKIKAPFGLWDRWSTSRYQGNLYGGGVSYGYQWILSRRLNLEGTFGIGYVHTKYDRFECQDCGDVIEKGVSKSYFGPTKVGVSLIYIIK